MKLYTIKKFKQQQKEIMNMQNAPKKATNNLNKLKQQREIMNKRKKLYTIRKDSEVLVLNYFSEMIDSFVMPAPKTFNENWLVQESVCSATDCPCDKKPFLIFAVTDTPHPSKKIYFQTYKSNVIISERCVSVNQ